MNNQDLGQTTKTAAEIAGEFAAEDGFIPREQLEQLANRVMTAPGTPLDMVNEISERAGLNQAAKLDLRRIVMAKMKGEKFSPGQTVMYKGAKVLVLEVEPPIPMDKAIVQDEGGNNLEVFQSDLEIE